LAEAEARRPKGVSQRPRVDRGGVLRLSLAVPASWVVVAIQLLPLPQPTGKLPREDSAPRWFRPRGREGAQSHLRRPTTFLPPDNSDQRPPPARLPRPSSVWPGPDGLFQNSSLLWRRGITPPASPTGNPQSSRWRLEIGLRSE